ncbi:MAG: 30S ribosomal protein S4 [Candidatus Aenigmatarchaeota archaeon]|nr:30S ribosomal protein S4 [Candidatus Aenigmarchaeota archaeon]
MKRQAAKFERPLKPWNRERIAHERKLMVDYGLRRKHEIWRAEAILRNFRQNARQLVATRDKKAEALLLSKLSKLGLVRPDATLDDVLALSTENILERRLQTIITRKGIATTPLQARQYIVHGHIAVDGQRVRWPGALVPVDAESKISLYEKSKLKGWISKPKGE